MKSWTQSSQNFLRGDLDLAETYWDFSTHMGETTANIDELRLRRFINPIYISNLGFLPVSMRNLNMRRNGNISCKISFALSMSICLWAHWCSLGRVQSMKLFISNLGFQKGPTHVANIILIIQVPIQQRAWSQFSHFKMLSSFKREFLCTWLKDRYNKT